MDMDQKSISQSVTFEKAAFVALIVTVVLGFLAFTPATFVSLFVVKAFVIGLGTVVTSIFFILSKLKSKSFRISFHPLVWAGAVTALVVLLASLFSPSVASSFLGTGFAPDTGLFILLLFVVGALSFALTKGRENRTFFVFSAILGSFSLLALLHIVRFFAGPGFLSLGTFTTVVTTTVGSWHDFGIFAGLSLIISLVTLQLLPITNTMARGLFIAVFVLAAVILIVVDLPSIWLVVGIAALAFSAYKFILNQRAAAAESKGSWAASLPIFSIIVVVVALIFAWAPGKIGSAVSSDIVVKAGASYTEVQLPWSLTLDIAESTIKNSPMFGAGPDRFVNQYLLYKPEVVNATPFWSSDFSNGSGFFLTGLVTEGILGFLAWVALAVAFLWLGAKLLLGKNEVSDNPFTRYGAAASYFGAGFLWISLIDYMPQHAILLALFVLTGIFAAHASASGKTVDFSTGSLKIPMIVISWILIAVSAVFIVFYAKDAIAEAYFQSAVEALNNGGTLSSTAQKIQTALKLDKNDVYYQAVSQLDVYALDQIISNSTSTPSQSVVQLVGGLVSDGINSSLLAEKFDPTNPYNYLSEAQVAVVAAGIGIPGAYGTATSSYQQALNLDPLDPSIYLALAKLAFFEKDDTGAKNYLNAALTLKPDYTDALFEAGIISYTDKDYATAVTAFTTVQQIDSTYPNIQSAIDASKAAETGSSVEPAATLAPAPVTSIASSTPAKTTSKAK